MKLQRVLLLLIVALTPVLGVGREIDVTDEASVESGVASATKQAGGLDVVVNNAGVGVLGLQETFDVDDWKKLFDVNVFGVQRVNRAVLPHMRERGSGLIIFVSSLLGRMTIPFYGPYNASKWALEALAEDLLTATGRNYYLTVAQELRTAAGDAQN